MDNIKRGIAGCLSFKPTMSSGDGEALQRNAKIGKLIKADKKEMTRTMKILLLGKCMDDGNYFDWSPGHLANMRLRGR